MSTFHFKGRAALKSPRRKRQRFFESKHRIGEVKNAEGKILFGTTLGAYVPVPGSVDELPGVFLTLSNTSGQCFTRISEADLAALHEWLHRVSAGLLAALTQATAHHTKLQHAESYILRRNESQEETEDKIEQTC